jgi:acyl carrier protein
MAISRDEIFQKVQQVLVDALGVDDDEVKPEATLMADLGAESIDFLDIVFRLEKAFEIKIPREELFPAENLMNDPEFVNNGKLTETGMGDPDINKLGDLFTVDAIVNYLDGKLNPA